MKKSALLFVLSGCIAFPVFAQGAGLSAKQTEVMKKLLVSYEAKAKEETKDKQAKALQFKPFTVEAGRDFYVLRRSWQATDPTCSGCHTEDPKKEGKHIETKKVIKPLAPVANPERFVDVDKVEKNFSEHCVDLLGRYCNASEKGNYITYMMSIK
jgi:hypothetical protein